MSTPTTKARTNNRSNAPKPNRRQDIYGGTLGGPLLKNKLFFFGNYQGTRFDAPGFETISLVPDAWRHGDPFRHPKVACRFPLSPPLTRTKAISHNREPTPRWGADVTGPSFAAGRPR